jgi:hypothetical protein
MRILLVEDEDKVGCSGERGLKAELRVVDIGAAAKRLSIIYLRDCSCVVRAIANGLAS